MLLLEYELSKFILGHYIRIRFVSPHHIFNVKSSLYNKITERLPGYASLRYKDKLLRLGLDSLAIQRPRLDLPYIKKLFVWSLVNQAACNMCTFGNSLHVTRTRGHVYKFNQRNSRVDVRNFSS